jgi:hypothetical protein
VHNPLTWFDPLGLDPDRRDDDSEPRFTPSEIKEIVDTEDKAAHQQTIDDAEDLAQIAGSAGNALDSVLKMLGKDVGFGDAAEWSVRLSKYIWDRWFT